MPLKYREATAPRAYRADFIVGSTLLVEVKSVKIIAPVHISQVLTYLRLLDLEEGLIINFNVRRLVDGLKRVLRTRDVG